MLVLNVIDAVEVSLKVADDETLDVALTLAVVVADIEGVVDQVFEADDDAVVLSVTDPVLDLLVVIVLLALLLYVLLAVLLMVTVIDDEPVVDLLSLSLELALVLAEAEAVVE